MRKQQRSRGGARRVHNLRFDRTMYHVRGKARRSSSTPAVQSAAVSASLSILNMYSSVVPKKEQKRAKKSSQPPAIVVGPASITFSRKSVAFGSTPFKHQRNRSTSYAEAIQNEPAVVAAASDKLPGWAASGWGRGRKREREQGVPGREREQGRERGRGPHRVFPFPQ